MGRRWLLQKNSVKPFIRHWNHKGDIGHYCPIRCLSSIAGIDSLSSRNVIHHPRNSGSGSWVVEMEKKEVLYLRSTKRNLLLAVDLYEDFLPWCQRSEIVRRNPDGSFDAELEIGFKFLVESYISHVVLDKPKFIKVASMFFREVVSRLVSSFTDRCRLLYGPGAIIEQGV